VVVAVVGVAVVAAVAGALHDHVAVVQLVVEPERQLGGIHQIIVKPLE
jgi:hypothetical protein